ncbi:secreted ookinete protein, putative [Plasmodium gallinaceum]|uniref:Secreted ookinete protein, putative n=1 Tax=Plasmodium gallinaceum TaxID=5849 RepID=A0A1J1H0E2_PLAGA|nr:secreted ookinete protein, putative [Plasmodium gallinaceum]CRG97915.1 secreted ookinete protein, putative [Plasmodium gallinaceum]
MITLKKIFYFFYLTYIIVKKVEGLDNSVVNYDNYTLYQFGNCMKQQYIYFLESIYKLCYLWKTIDEKTVSKILVQKGKDSSWEVKSELIYRNKDLSSLYFSYVLNKELIVLMCYSNFQLRKYECVRSVSHNGIKFNTTDTSFSSDPHSDSSMDNYSSLPFNFSGVNYLLICSLNKNPSRDGSLKLFITCSGSKDKGITWKTIFRFYYSSDSSFKYYKLAPRISEGSIGFQYVKHNNSTWTHEYIECNHRKDYDFECKNIDLQKKNKVLQIALKVGNYYVSSYMGKNNYLCYLYYTSDNIVLIKTKINKNKKGDCNPRDLIMVDDSKVVLVYADGMNIDGFSTYRFINN